METLIGIPTDLFGVIALGLVTVFTIVMQFVSKKQKDQMNEGLDKSVEFMEGLFKVAKELGLDPVTAIRNAVADGTLTIDEALKILTEINEGLGSLDGVKVTATVKGQRVSLKKK